MHPGQGLALGEAQAAGGVVHGRGDLAQAGIHRLQGHGEEAHQVGIDQGGDAAG